MVEQMLSNNMLLGGFDTGNIKAKISFLNEKGNIESFSVPTVIAEAPPAKIDLKSAPSKKNDYINEKDEDIELLHVRIISNSLDGDARSRAWYVGAYAKDQEDRQEPTVDEMGKTEDKFSQKNKKLHLIPLFTSMAVAAARIGKEEVSVPFSGGMPIEDYKLRGEEQILEMLYGEHTVEFLDGTYEGKKIKITINDGTMNVEGVSSVLALLFDIVNGEIVEVEGMDAEIGESYAINDLGAGTSDNAFFEDGELNKKLSTNTDLGTNKYIDEILKNIKERFMENEILKSFMTDEIESPFKTREDFIQRLVMPEVEKMIEDDTYKPTFSVKWGPVKENVTDIVMDGMLKYAEDQKASLMKFWFKTNADKNIVVGGGVLFGYAGLRDLKEQDGFILPKNIQESAYFTSRSYLIANLLEQLNKEGVEA
ncbi:MULTISPECIES: ParM/StbA family protein [Bacillus cereus group]|uniref:ParM/StbA family protein n=1 Tax=Bacillus cereus group TaxID=86661 RepID=UPI0021110349|nr:MULTISPECIES: ParM/StbA family protein [Bacillus cereus group]MCQ6336556.1 ParM/StbA family protein [Bacillus cereus]MDF9490456.1 ParM/StbA family protein [Bacillus cereus]MDF9512550.1 ParM/StbA family protein [Bacillus paranthracis]MDG1620850.1 ParM/StbA family protein [Bacillus mobilis]HEF5239047.1 ParM/StbA family protein [Bacillus cereus]